MPKKQDNESAMFRPPEKIKSISQDHFAFAMQLASAASSYRMPMESPAKTKMSMEMPDGKVQEFAFTDIPLNRAAMAIRDHFAPDMETAWCALMRWMALVKVASSPNMRKWERRSGENPEWVDIHGAVIDAAAIMPLNRNGGFDKREFFRKVKEIAASEKYAEEK